MFCRALLVKQPKMCVYCVFEMAIGDGNQPAGGREKHAKFWLITKFILS